MKQTICNAVYTAIKNNADAKKITMSWKDLGFRNFDDMLNQIKTNVQVALWVLMELEHFSYWENDFIIDFTEEYGAPIYKVGDLTFTIEYPPYDGDFIITPMKKATKTVVQTFWDVDDSIKI